MSAQSNVLAAILHAFSGVGLVRSDPCRNPVYDERSGIAYATDRKALVRFDGSYFRACYIGRLCMAAAMVYEGYREPKFYVGPGKIAIACCDVQAAAMHVWGATEGWPGVVVDARTLDVSDNLPEVSK